MTLRVNTPYANKYPVGSIYDMQLGDVIEFTGIVKENDGKSLLVEFDTANESLIGI